MVDFRKLSASGGARAPKTLLDTFNQLDRQVSHVELRPSQVKILELIDSRGSDKDLVVKLSTGGGKTTIGLLYLKHKLVALSQPVVYLVPTVQLVAQVIEEGRRIGFPVFHWAAKETYPPDGGLNGQGAIVCTYDKFFNGKSTFARSDVALVPAAIVLDDVHAGIEVIRKDFSFELPEDCRGELMALLKGDIEALNPAEWIGVEYGDHRAILEIPHWIVSTHIDKIRKIISKYSGLSEVTFAWPHLSGLLENCRLIFSGVSAYVALDPPSVERVAHYGGAAHRLFMSASLHDGAVLVRELDCDPHSAEAAIQISEEASVGERMVIVPSLITPDFSRDELMSVAAAVRHSANVVVLVPSFEQAKEWEAVGARVAKNETIADEIRILKSTTAGQFVVFVQRYDGVDLPDSACRLLVIDGLPKGETLLDRADLQMMGGVVGMRGKVAVKIEQGLGRAVRSSSDYCAVLLGGRDLSGFVSRSVVLENFSPHTVRQLEIGRTVSEAMKDAPDRVTAVIETVMQCLRRDAEWKSFYVGQMKLEPASLEEINRNASRNLEGATLERNAARRAAARDYGGASQLLQRAAALHPHDRSTRGALKQSAAKSLFEVDQVGAMELQSSAYLDNHRVSRPPTIQSVDVRRISSQAEVIASWLSEFREVNGALLELDELRSRLAFANEPRAVEEAMRRLGELLGRRADPITKSIEGRIIFGFLVTLHS